MSENGTVSDGFAEAVHQRAAVLAPGWEIAVEATGWPEFPTRVLLDHPLSNGHQILFKQEQVDALDLSTLQAHVAFAANEFAQIARAPVCPNARLLRGLRSLWDAYDWPPHQVAGLAGVLADNGALAPEEYEWLRKTV